jgi:hypothetical protein
MMRIDNRRVSQCIREFHKFGLMPEGLRIGKSFKRSGDLAAFIERCRFQDPMISVIILTYKMARWSGVQISRPTDRRWIWSDSALNAGKFVNRSHKWIERGDAFWWPLDHLWGVSSRFVSCSSSLLFAVSFVKSSCWESQSLVASAPRNNSRFVNSRKNSVKREMKQKRRPIRVRRGQRWEMAALEYWKRRDARQIFWSAWRVVSEASPISNAINRRKWFWKSETVIGKTPRTSQ